jgi:hypothetical protein
MSTRIAHARRWGAVALAVVLLLVVAWLVPALAATPDPILGGGLYAPNAALKYRWSSAGTPPSAMQAAINRGVSDANGTRLSKAPTFAYASNAGNLVYYGTSVPCGVNALACMRRDPPDWFGVWYRENGHRYDWGSLRWCEMTGSPTGCFEAENVALHEFGHVMILDHHVNLPDGSDALDSVMQTYQPAKAKAGWNAHAYARCDVATLQQQYDVPSTTTAYSTCLDIPTTLSVTASRTSVGAGSMVTFTGVLETDGSGRLSDNRVSSRTVVIQQRLSSGWSDVATMTAGSSGTYTTSLNMWATRDYRALFRSPANEGLRASSSSSVTVTVTATCTSGLCPQSIIDLAR